MLQAADIFLRLYHDIFIKHDATMIEINPMSESNDGTGTCLLIDCVICYLLHTYLIFLNDIIFSDVHKFYKYKYIHFTILVM